MCKADSIFPTPTITDGSRHMSKVKLPESICDPSESLDAGIAKLEALLRKCVSLHDVGAGAVVMKTLANVQVPTGPFRIVDSVDLNRAWAEHCSDSPNDVAAVGEACIVKSLAIATLAERMRGYRIPFLCMSTVGLPPHTALVVSEMRERVAMVERIENQTIRRCCDRLVKAAIASVLRSFRETDRVTRRQEKRGKRLQRRQLTQQREQLTQQREQLTQQIPPLLVRPPSPEPICNFSASPRADQAGTGVAHADYSTCRSECPVCFEDLGERRTMFMCCAAARICDKCGPKVDACPLCRGSTKYVVVLV